MLSQHPSSWSRSNCAFISQYNPSIFLKWTITLVDWIGMWANSLTAEKEPAWQKAYLDYMFRLLDASGK
ncbi:hypothetical protein Y032_0908g2987 [Ancylostoma ceylanicum]|nr:hypothetical protein Y032_0908g2987 [Ancylostoma ceylanicum]